MGVLVATAPLIIGLAVDVAESPHTTGYGAVVMELSPIGSIVRQAEEARFLLVDEVPFPPFAGLIWLLVGVLAWGIGVLAHRRVER